MPSAKAPAPVWMLVVCTRSRRHCRLYCSVLAHPLACRPRHLLAPALSCLSPHIKRISLLLHLVCILSRNRLELACEHLSPISLSIISSP